MVLRPPISTLFPYTTLFRSFEIYTLLDELAEAGKAIVMVSSDLRELMAVCDRIAVMSAGRLVETFARGDWSEAGLLAAALSGYTVSVDPLGGGDSGRFRGRSGDPLPGG